MSRFIHEPGLPAGLFALTNRFPVYTGQRFFQLGNCIMPKAYITLENETRSHVETACAAHHLMRASQTLRSWASTGQGLLQPIRAGRKLGWPVADIRRLLAGGQ